MPDSHDTRTQPPDAPGTGTTERTVRWMIALAVLGTLVVCGCGLTVLLVLTGIIAEPETVIEQLLRGLLGG
ncbi:MAG: hypothetical protein Kow0067_16470 [Coriobacteriia bacterium]|nr:hypothetical protein [Anaerosomatales bacterium]